MTVEVDDDKKTLNVYQELTFNNQTNDTLNTIVLNDWNNAYSNSETPLGKRFSDEFVRSFHLATEKEKGSTNNLTIIDSNKSILNWSRPIENPDLVEVQLKNTIFPNQKVTFILSYVLKIPDDKYTNYGYNSNADSTLKNWLITPAKYENHNFLKYSNLNLDDVPNATFDADLKIIIPKEYKITSDLIAVSKEDNIYAFSDKKINDIPLYIEKKLTFSVYKNDTIEVLCNIKDGRVNEIYKAIIIEKIVNYVSDNLGRNRLKKITISQSDYDNNPFYGLNQLPRFISPFPDDFIYELKFLKTYLNNYLKNSIQLDSRKDNWVFDAIQVYYMMKYIDAFYPDAKMMGNIANYKLFKGYNLVSLDFNEQYSYFYMLMARKNLDQPLGNSKNTLIKFNEQIASKYRAGISFRYLDNYLGNSIVTSSIQQFYKKNQEKQVSKNDFESILKSNSNTEIDWFFNTIINSREIIDYKFSMVSKTKDSIKFSIKNKTNVTVPIPVYGLKKEEIVFKKWLYPNHADSVYVFQRKEADKIVLNYKNEVPEYNLRNNWKSFKGFLPTNRPIKFNFLKDLEDSYYNQILYVPTLTYNLYDGISPGIRLHNKTILDKPFNFEINPAYSTTTKTVSGFANFAVNQNNRNSKLFTIRYSLSGSFFHYAQEASYLKINPMAQLRIREANFRDNRKQLIIMRQVLVNREQSDFVTDVTNQNYSVFNIKYYNTKTEVTNHFNFSSDLQLSGKFGKISSEIEYRKLFENNRQINLRLYVGSFLYNKTYATDYFSFALDRPTDYLFDYNFYGRSESSGFFSQQFIMAEGGFKSKLNTPYANQWITTLNASYSIWNWIEAYGDIGVLKKKSQNAAFVYDSGIKLNLVPDYFELYFPVYSNNGWEIAQNNYNEKIRFVVTFNPKTLINLFTRKWF
ncbi:aminopeptidase [Flavobacterium sp.]|uniref:aminopeptidase n=1 Tax=Flavobacterium sp. TaxID=239 RepID=UPI0038D3B62E